jgi:Fe-S-cluster containining protein
MDVHALVGEVEEVFNAVADMTIQVGLHSGLACPPGCGRCCNNPAIDVYPIEFLPLAVHLHDTGNAELFLEGIAHQEAGLCPLYQPAGMGCCTAHQYRGLICRLMGYSAMRNKHGQRKLIACSVFKEGQPEQILLAEKYLESTDAPFASQFYDRLVYLCPSLAAGPIPIKQAIQKAIEYVGHRAYYKREAEG